MIPQNGRAVYWRMKGSLTPYKYGYVTRIEGSRLIRMGAYSGDRTGGCVVDPYEIEWRNV